MLLTSVFTLQLHQNTSENIADEQTILNHIVWIRYDIIYQITNKLLY